ncbi:restriction endonuclease subunit S [Blastococcus sp. SYSU DS1024]
MQRAPLKRLVRIVNGGTPTADEENWGGDVAWATPEDLSGGGRDLVTTRRYLTEQGLRSGSALVPAGSVILSTRAPIGSLKLAAVPMAFNQGCRGLVPRPGVDSRFVAYSLEAHRADLQARGQGSTFMELSSASLGSWLCPAPSPAAQRAIADALDRELEHLEEVRRSKLELLTLNAERRDSAVANAIFGTSGGGTIDSGIPSIGAVPAHWRLLRNKNLFREVADLAGPDATEEDLLSVSHLTGVTRRADKDVNMFLAQSFEAYKRVQPGDLVINTMWAWMGALGVSNIHGIVSPAYGVYRPVHADVVPAYFDLLYRSSAYVCEMTRHSKGVWTSRLRLYPESFLALTVPVPPPDEQRRIVAAVADQLDSGAELETTVRQSLQRLGERRLALITAAVTGQMNLPEVAA